MEPRALLGHAKAIVRSGRGKPQQIALRRAISASYYSLFHAFLRAAANDLVGTTRKAARSTAYRLVYRAFQHSDMRRFCQDVDKERLPQRYSEALGFGQFDGAIRIAAKTFVRLQELRHGADYDPQIRFRKSDAILAINQAITAIVMLENSPEEERRNFLLCMLVPLR